MNEFYAFVLTLCLGCVIGTILILGACNRLLSRWACDVFGWHYVDDIEGCDGISLTSHCSRCGKAVLQDSQGNWF